jgi:hypothetical protein
MTEPTMIPFNPVVSFHGDVKTFAMLGPIQGPMEYNQVERNDKVDVNTIPRVR